MYMAIYIYMCVYIAIYNIKACKEILDEMITV